MLQGPWSLKRMVWDWWWLPSHFHPLKRPTHPEKRLEKPWLYLFICSWHWGPPQVWQCSILARRPQPPFGPYLNLLHLLSKQTQSYEKNALLFLYPPLFRRFDPGLVHCSLYFLREDQHIKSIPAGFGSIFHRVTSWLPSCSVLPFNLHRRSSVHRALGLPWDSHSFVVDQGPTMHEQTNPWTSSACREVCGLKLLGTWQNFLIQYHSRNHIWQIHAPRTKCARSDRTWKGSNLRGFVSHHYTSCF